ncbi:MAG: hypothetical protein Hens3KO_25830 [Henriciella sp.]
MRVLSVFLTSLVLLVTPMSADSLCDESEAACILQAAWGAALVLPEDKKQRLKPAFVELAGQAGGADLQQIWVRKLSILPSELQSTPSDYGDFGWSIAEGVIEADGVDGLIRHARDKRAPLNYGRSDALLSAGKRLYASQELAGEKLNQALFDLAGSASDFERPELLNAAAELAMYRCDLRRFDLAMTRQKGPGNLRYDLWRARMVGGASSLTNRIRDQADSDDTRHVRQVLEGYRAIVELGYCPSAKR